MPVDQIDRAIGARLRMRRHKLGMTQRFVAARLGISFQQLQKYEIGVNRISASMLVQVACILRCAPSAFLDDTGHAVEPEAKDVATLLKAQSRIKSPELRRLLVKIARDFGAQSPAQPEGASKKTTTRSRP